MAEFQGYMTYGGNCISDWARVNAYLCSEDAQCKACGCLPTIINDLSCMEDHDTDGYGDSPDFEDNPAPWYDANVPASGEFLGLYVTEMTGLDGPPYLRSNSVNNSVGASLSRLKFNGRSMTVKGTMYATTVRGMDYGIRWVNQFVLGASSCDGCPEDELVIRVACSADPLVNPDDGLLTLKRVGVLDPPRYDKPIERCGNFVREVAWSFFSELPWMYSQKLDTATITFLPDLCETTWCNECPPAEPPCKKDELPEWLISLNTNKPPDTYVATTTYNIGDTVNYSPDGIYCYQWTALATVTGETPGSTVVPVEPDTLTSHWGQQKLLGSWTKVGWTPTATVFPPVDHHLVVVDSINVENQCNITVYEDGTFSAVDFDLLAGIPSTCTINVQNSEKYSGCEDPVFDSIFDSLLLTDCACIPPYANKAAAQIGDIGDWIDGTAVVTIKTGTSVVRHLVLEVFENPQGLPLPTVDPTPWECRERCGGLIIPYLPANSVLTFDGRSRTVTLKCGQSVQSGEKYVYALDGTLFSWIDVSCVPLVLRALAHPIFHNEETSITVDVWERKI